MAAVVAEAPEGSTELEFWHAMGGELGEVVDDLVNRFNASQSDVFVKAPSKGPMMTLTTHYLLRLKPAQSQISSRTLT